MAKPKPNYYEILGLKPDAKHTDVGIAFSRKLAAMRREDAPPDARGEDTLRQAFAVLGDLDQRSEYDRSLVAERLKPAFTAKQGITAVVFVGVVVSAITWYLLKRNAENVAQVQGLSPEMIAAQTTAAVGRLTSTDMGGQSKPIGLAFAIDAGVMVASCEGIVPNAQLTVNMNPRVVPARVTMTDEGRGLCKLEVEGAGSWPIPVAASDARAGDIVYATSVNAVGEVVLKEGRVKSVLRNGPVATLDATVGPSTSGAPLLDRQGRVVGVVTVASGTRQHMVLPRTWTEAPKNETPYVRDTSANTPESALPPRVEEDNAGQLSKDGVVLSRTGKPLPVTQQQADRLNKAFRPPPNVPKELE
jgi:S1-C subfamily serine protease